MKRIASPRPKRTMSPNDAGFTLTELVAGLLVASMLVAGLVDLTRRYALTSVRVKDAILDTRTSRLAQALMNQVERADPQTLVVTQAHLSAEIGEAHIEATLSDETRDHDLLTWTSPAINRTLRVPEGARFARTPAGAVVLQGAAGQPPLATITLDRQLPIDCQFDTITRECR